MSAFVVHDDDNVAVALTDCPVGSVNVHGALSLTDLVLDTPVQQGHKIAIRAVPPGAAVVKYGVRIGHAKQMIRRGEWVHLHNLASDLDARSGTMDSETGAPTDTEYQ